MPPGPVELRRVDKNGISVAGRPRFAADLHDWGGRDVLVFPRAPGALPILTRGGQLTQGVYEQQLTAAFRDAFYANRRRQRTTIEQHRLAKYHRDVAATLTPRNERQSAPPPAPAIRRGPLDSPLDAFRPLGRLGWPFDELAETTSSSDGTRHAPPLRRA